MHLRLHIQHQAMVIHGTKVEGFVLLLCWFWVGLILCLVTLEVDSGVTLLKVGLGWKLGCRIRRCPASVWITPGRRHLLSRRLQQSPIFWILMAGLNALFECIRSFVSVCNMKYNKYSKDSVWYFLSPMILFPEKRTLDINNVLPWKLHGAFNIIHLNPSSDTHTAPFPLSPPRPSSARTDRGWASSHSSGPQKPHSFPHPQNPNFRVCCLTH